MEPWRCESLRLTALWPDARDVSSLFTWESVVGSSPDHRESQPRLHSAREIGSISEASLNLELRSTPGRADWILAPIAPTPGDVPFINFPNLFDALATFAHVIFEKSADSYDAVRIALGVAAVRPTADRRESY